MNDCRAHQAGQLFMNGCDHQTPNYALPEFIRYFNETHDDYELRQVSLTQYLDELHITPGDAYRTLRGTEPDELFRRPPFEPHAQKYILHAYSAENRKMRSVRQGLCAAPSR